MQTGLLTQFIELVTKQQQSFTTLVADGRREGEGLKSRQVISLTSTDLIFYHTSPCYIFNLLDQGHHVSLVDHLSVHLPQRDLHVKLDETIA